MSSEALITKAVGGTRILERTDIPIPKPEQHQVLVKISRAAQNPTDIQAFDANVFGDDAVLGCDFTGTVQSQGSRYSKGDVIAGLIWGGETKGLGAYAHHTVADEKISFKVPKNINLDQAATVPLASLTALLALFSKDCLGIDREKDTGASVLVWGGSSSVGQFTVQIAALYGLKVIATCSPHHFDTVKALGASEVFNYRDEGVVESIKKAAPGLKYVFDTIGNSTSSVLGSRAIGGDGGTLCTVRPGKAFTENCSKGVKITDVLVWTAFLKDHQYKEFKWPANEADHKLAADFCEKLPEYLESGKIKPNPTKVMDGGLDDVSKGFQEYRDGKISGYKIVYELE